MKTINADFKQSFRNKFNSVLFSHFYPEVPDEEARILISALAIDLLADMLSPRSESVTDTKTASNQALKKQLSEKYKDFEGASNSQKKI